MNGDGARAGLKQVTSERKQADLGANGLGRLVVSAPTATSVQVAEDAVSPFGFKLAGVTTSISSATVTPSGPPAASTVDLGATNPNDGDTVKFTFTLPDGSSESITLTATTANPPAANQFTIGATSDRHRGQSAGGADVRDRQARRHLADGGVGGRGLERFLQYRRHPSAAARRRSAFRDRDRLVAGTPADTVSWYTGEMGPIRRARPRPRGSIRRSRCPMACAPTRRASATGAERGGAGGDDVLAAAIPTRPRAAPRSTSGSEPRSTCRPARRRSRTSRPISPARRRRCRPPATATARPRRRSPTCCSRSKACRTRMWRRKILALQTRLQASLQTTALLYKTSLVNYL